jgi:rubrerythrin
VRAAENKVRALNRQACPKPGIHTNVQHACSSQTLSQPEEKEELVQIRPKLWYCKQCGYVVYREDPPYVCPICKAKREMFAEIKTKIEFYMAS